MLQATLFFLFFAFVQCSCPVPSIVTLWDLPDVTITETVTSTVQSCSSCSSSSSKTTQTLQPNTHWNQNTNNPQALIPNSQVPQYYAPQAAGPQSTHSFQWVNTTLTAPAIPLDQSSLLTYTWSGSSNTLMVTFNSPDAFKAAQAWAVSNIFVVFTPGCGNYDGGDNCYISATSISFGSNTCTIIGTVLTLADCLDTFTASFGVYTPSNSVGSGSSSSLNLGSIISSAYSKHITASTVSGGGWGNWQKPATTTSWGRQKQVIPVNTSPGAWANWPSLASGSSSSRSFSISQLSTTTGSTDPGTITTSSGLSSTAAASFSSSSPSQTMRIPSSTSAITPTSGFAYASTSTSNTGASSSGMTSSTSMSGQTTSIVSGSSDSTNHGSTSTTSTSISDSTSSGMSTTTSHGTSSGISSYTTTSHSTITSPATTGSFSAVSSSISSMLSSMTSATKVDGTNCGKVLDSHGLPTACIGPNFDLNLDSIDGLLTLSQSDFAGLAQLYPGIFTDSAKRALFKRCGPSDTQCQISSIAQSASSIIASAAASAASAGQTGTIPASAVAAAATGVASAIAQAAADNGQPLSADQQAAIANEVQAGVAVSVKNIDISTSFDVTTDQTAEKISVTPPTTLLHDSPWGQQALLKTFKDTSSSTKSSNSSTHSSAVDYDLNIYCVDCGVTGTITMYGEVAGSLTQGITKFSVNFNGNFDVAVGIGLDATIDVTEQWNTVIAQEGIPDLCSGTTLCIGPSISLGATLTVTADTEGYLLAGGTWTFSGATASLDPYNGASQSGWTPTFSPKYDVGGSEDITVTFGLPVAINCGVSILDGKINKQASLTLTPSISAEATISANSNNGITTDNGNCKGVEVQVDYDVSLDYSVFGLKSGTLWTLGQQQLTAFCLALTGGGNGGGNFGPTPPTPTPGAGGVSLIDTSDQTPLIHCGNGNVYKVASGYAGTDKTCTSAWTSYLLPGLLAQTVVIAGGVNQLPIMFPAEFSAAGVSRLQVVSTSQIPGKANAVDFSNVNPFNGGYVPQASGTSYQLVQCTNQNAASAGIGAGMNEVFIIDPQAATTSVTTLQGGSVEYSITNGLVSNCKILKLSMSTTVVPAIDPDIAF